jgi:hypothetical protein
LAGWARSTGAHGLSGRQKREFYARERWKARYTAGRASPSQMPDIALALLALIPLTAVELAKAARWRVLFGVHRPSYAVALRALVAGQVTNALSPVRAGDAVRLGVLSAQGGALVPGAASLAGAKAIDTLCLGAIAFAVAGASVFAQRTAGFAAGAAVIAAGVPLAVWGGRLRGPLERNPITRKLRLAALVDVSQALREPRVLLVCGAATAIVWASGLVANAFVLAAAGAPSTLDLASRVIVAGYLVNLLPSPPAQIGTFEAAVTVALTTAGIPVETALLASVTLHGCQLIKLAVLFGGSLLIAWVRRDREPRSIDES